MNIVSEEDSFVTQHYEEIYRQIRDMKLCEKLCLKSIEQKQLDLIQFQTLYKQLKASLQIHLSIITNKNELAKINNIHQEVFKDTQLQYLNIVLKSQNFEQFVFDIDLKQLMRNVKVQSKLSKLCFQIKKILCCKL